MRDGAVTDEQASWVREHVIIPIIGCTIILTVIFTVLFVLGYVVSLGWHAAA